MERGHCTQSIQMMDRGHSLSGAVAALRHTAGAIEQVKLLRRDLQDFKWSEFSERIVNNLIAGLDRMHAR